MNSNHLEITGEGPAIIMVHGWGQTRAAMAPLAQALAGRGMAGQDWAGLGEGLIKISPPLQGGGGELIGGGVLANSNYKVINIDLPGHGAAKDLPGPYAFAGYTDWIRRIALQHTDGKFHLLGWSMGGSIAALYALEKIEPRPLSLILLNAPARFIAPKGSGMGQSLSSVRRLSEQVAADHEGALKTFIEFFFLSGEKIAPEMTEPIRAALAPPAEFPPGKEALLATLEQLTELDLTLHPSAPGNMRGLIINGTLDRICPAAGQALWDMVFMNLDKVTMDKCGHAPHLTRLGQTASAINNFLSGSN